jgi:hypothetical protein
MQDRVSQDQKSSCIAWNMHRTLEANPDLLAKAKSYTGNRWERMSDEIGLTVIEHDTWSRKVVGKQFKVVGMSSELVARTYQKLWKMLQ